MLFVLSRRCLGQFALKFTLLNMRALGESMCLYNFCPLDPGSSSGPGNIGKNYCLEKDKVHIVF